MTAVKKTHWLRNTVIVLLVCGILGTVLTAVQFNAQSEKARASASIEFTFEGAADGLAPNKLPFSPDEIATDTVLTAAIEEAGLVDVVLPEQVRACLTVRGVYPKNIVEQMTSYDSLLNADNNRELTLSSYHPTVFSLSLENSFTPALNQNQLISLRDGILNAYRHYFTERYSFTLNAEILPLDLGNYDYPQQADILAESIRQQARYADELSEKLPNFNWNGMSFSDISVRLNALIGTEVSKINASISMNALTRDMTRLLSWFRFRIRELSASMTQQKERLDRLNSLITDYNKSVIFVSNGSSLVKIDKTSSATYDQLITFRQEAADDIASINTNVVTYQQRVADLVKGTGEEELAEKLEESVTETNVTETEPVKNAEQSAQEPDALSEAGIIEMETSEPVLMTDEEIATVAEAVQEAAAGKITVLERDIRQLIVKRDAVLLDFKNMLNAYNTQEINESTVAVISRKYKSPSFFSTDFLKKTLMTAGPLCSLGFIVCVLLLISSRRKEKTGIL